MKKRSTTLGLLLVAVSLLLAPPSARARGLNASIRGTVIDPTGAIIPNARLTLKALITGAVASVTSGESGLYSFQDLLPGVYNLKVAAKGYSELRPSIRFHIIVGYDRGYQVCDRPVSWFGL